MEANPPTSINNDETIVKKVAKGFGEEVINRRQKHMSYIERKEFIEYLFKFYDTFDLAKSRWNLSKEITERYREETKQPLNIEWVAALLKYGICQYEDGTYGFEKDIGYTVDDLCRNPMLMRKVKL